MEAEMLIALEALKTSTTYVWSDIDMLKHKIEDQFNVIGANQDDIYEN